MSYESALTQPHTPIDTEVPPRRTEFGFEDYTAEDLANLLDSSKNLYEYALMLEDAAKSADKYDEEAAVLLDKMNAAVIELDVLEDADSLSEEEYVKMVDVYDGLKENLRAIETLYSEFIDDEGEVLPPASEVNEGAPEVSLDDNTFSEMSPDEVVDTELAGSAPEEPASEAATGAHQDAVAAPPESSFRTETALSAAEATRLQERAGDLVEEVSGTRNRLYSLFPKTERDDEIRTLLKELDVSHTRTTQLQNEIRDTPNNARFERIQDEIRENLTAIEAGLQHVQHERTQQESSQEHTSETEDRESTAEQTQSSQSTPQVATESPPRGPDNVAEQEGTEATEHPEPSSVSAPDSPTEAIAHVDAAREHESVVPGEAEVAKLMKRVTESQFYTAEERETAQSFYEAYHRSVAEGQPANVQRQSYQNLHEFITQLVEEPSPEYVVERADRILDRITAGSSTKNADTLETAKAMRQMIDRIAANPEKTEADVLQAYRNLENYARETESEWITIAGMHPPQPGPDGVFGARSLREGLMATRDRHKEFQQNPRKRLLVDKMVRLLSYVPKEGLSENDIEELKRLMREIDVPGKLIGNSATENVADTVSTEQRSTEAESTHDIDPQSSDTEPPIPSASRASTKLTVTSDEADQSGGNVTVSVRSDSQSSAGAATTQNTPARSQDVAPIPPANEESIASTERTTDTMDTEPVPDNLSAADEDALGEIEGSDPVNDAVPIERPTVRSWKERRREGQLIDYSTIAPAYPQFFAQVETAELDRVVRAEVAAFERKTIDGIESWLNISYRSAFDYMKHMTLAELDELLSTYGAAERDEFTNETNVKYDALRSWYDRISEMSRLVAADDDMTFGELFTRFIIEQEIR